MKDLLVWLLQSGPLALTAGLFVALMLTCELGYRLGRRRADKAAGDRTAHAAASTLAATMLALMAFLLGLTINAAQTRFEARREMVVTEANVSVWPRPDLRFPPEREPGTAVFGFPPAGFFRAVRDRFLATHGDRMARMMAWTE